MLERQRFAKKSTSGIQSLRSRIYDSEAGAVIKAKHTIVSDPQWLYSKLSIQYLWEVRRLTWGRDRHTVDNRYWMTFQPNP